MTENIEQVIADAIANGTPVKLRDGSKAFLKYDDRKEPAVLSGEIKLGKYPINGYKACSPTNADCSGESWTEGGKYLQYKEGNFDIIGAWVEPRPTRIINGIEASIFECF